MARKASTSSQEATVGHVALARSPVMRRLYELAESRGVEVYWTELPKRFNGMFFRSDGGVPIIALNLGLRGRWRSFVFAHELGHAVLKNSVGFSFHEADQWDDEKRRKYIRMERQTDEFACRLLHFIRRGIEARRQRNAA